MRLARSAAPEEPSDGMWLRVEGLRHGLDMHVLVSFDEAGKPVIQCVRLAGSAVHTEHLRSIPLGQIERQLRFSIDRETSPTWEQHPDGTHYLWDYSDTGHPADVGRRRDDESAADFARRVADAYRWYAAQSGKPAVEMAKGNGVPVGTVRRWIREARALGALPPGRQGQVG